eukprot:31389-Pelagococcus_subviridis.AAC.11
MSARARTSPSRRTSRRSRTRPPSTTRPSAPPRARASPCAVTSGDIEGDIEGVSGPRREEERDARISDGTEREKNATTRAARACIPSLAKLMPSAGSGSSGGTSSAGSCTSQVPSGLPYRHRFSLSGSHWS